MDRLSPSSIAHSIAHNDIQIQRQQRQGMEAELLLDTLGLVGADCAVFLSNSAPEKQCTRWLETRVPWWIDRGAVRIDWRLCPVERSGSRSRIEEAEGLAGFSVYFTDFGVADDRLITVHWFNFCDPVLELPWGALRPCLGAIVQRCQPVWLFDRQAGWCVEYWPTDGAADLRWGDWSGANDGLNE
jgi:hypothetical protein